MKYQKKLTLLLITVSLLSCGVSAGLSYYETRTMLLDQIRSKATSIAATGATLISGEKLREIQTRDDESSAHYADLTKLLRNIRDANRRPDAFIKNAYTLRRSRLSPTVVEFVLDAEERPEDFSHVGDVYKGTNENVANLDLGADETFTHDQWGEWLSATAPIKTSSGQTVGALGIDMRAADVSARLADLLLAHLAGVGCAAGLVILLSWRISKRVTEPLSQLKSGADQYRRGDFDRRIIVDTGDEFAELAKSMNEMAAAIKERETVKSAFARYVSQQVLDSILSSETGATLKGQRRRVTIFFSDIRGFTRMAESMAPEDVVAFLDAYFERMVDITFRNHGTLDKFLGDGLMAIFGAPTEDPFQEEHAIRAALEMQSELELLSKKLEQEGHPPLRIGIGINSGNAIVGNIGSETRMEYTAVGDTVNVASRIESLTKETGSDVLISESTYDAVRHAVEAKEMGSLSIKGRVHPVVCYAVSGWRRQAASK